MSAVFPNPISGRDANVRLQIGISAQKPDIIVPPMIIIPNSVNKNEPVRLKMLIILDGVGNNSVS